MSFYQQNMFGFAMSCGLEVDHLFSSSRRNGGPSEAQHAPQAYPAMCASMTGYQTVSNCNPFGGFDAMYHGNPLAISGSSVGEPFRATLPSAFGDGYSSGTQGMYMGGFGSYYPQDSFSTVSHPYIDPFPAFGTPDLSPSLSSSRSQTISPFRSPVDEYAPDPQLLIPQPSLAGPSAYPNVIHQPVDMGIEYGFGPVNMGAEASMLGQHASASSQFPSIHGIITTEERSLSASNVVSPIGTNMEVPAPTPPRPSSLPSPPTAPPAPRKKAQRARKTRSSVSKKAKSTKASASTSTVPCTEPGCKVLCFDEKTRDRHALLHNRTAAKNYYCPGKYIPRASKQKACRCKESGYTREDALLRHLRAAKPDNPCVLEAKKLGWDRDVKGSVQKLRVIVPQPPPQ